MRWMAIAAVAALMMTSPAMGDPWKDESGHGRKGGKEWKQEYRDGNCKVERKWERSGEYKEEINQVRWSALGQGIRIPSSCRGPALDEPNQRAAASAAGTVLWRNLPG
jgi:hypothetical protein